MDPRDAIDEIREELQDLLACVSSYPPQEIPEVFEQLSEHFAALGICKLLISGDSQGFRSGLTQSGYARRFLLKHLSPDTGQLHLGLNRSDALLDALAGGCLSLAGELASVSTSTWLPSREYEEDFLYRRILGLLTPSNGDPDGSVDDLLDRMETVQGGSSTRSDLCRALSDTEAEPFAEAVAQLSADYAAAVEEGRPLVGEADYLFWPRSFIHIEALAIVQLGAARGMSIAVDLPLCPPVARLDPGEADPIDLTEEAHKVDGRG